VQRELLLLELVTVNHNLVILSQVRGEEGLDQDQPNWTRLSAIDRCLNCRPRLMRHDPGATVSGDVVGIRVHRVHLSLEVDHVS
jgi:hypothetical protein